MGYKSLLLKSPKKEEQEVPDTTFSRSTNYINEDIEEAMQELEGILNINEEEEEKYNRQFANWDFLNFEYRPREDYLDQEEDYKFDVIKNQCSNEDAGSYGCRNKRNLGFWDGDEKRVSLNLNLNYQEVLDAWSDRGPLWAEDSSFFMASNGYYMGEVPMMEEERTRREASVLRYKEKRQSRLFAKKIRYEVRKLNADKRPRLKGRFVKRESCEGR